jgi:hypothetical protein
MTATLMFISLQDNTAPKTVINVTVQPAFPVSAAQGGGAALFHGVAPNNGGRGPGASASILQPNLILIQGGFEEAFVEAFVDASNGVTGTITVDPPIPVPINISLLGGGNLYTLPGNSASGEFNLQTAGGATAPSPASTIQARAAEMSKQSN